MATVNRRSGMISGGQKWLQAQVAQAWKGLQVIRNYSGNIQQIPSNSKNTVKAKMGEFASRFRETLTDSQRNAWDQYAGTLGSAVDRERSDNVATAKNIIPRRKKLMSGINAYVGANVDAFLAGMATPLDTPPIGEHIPPPPINVGVTYATGTATVSFTEPNLVGGPTAKYVRLWVTFQGGMKIHPQLVAHVTLPSGAPITFTELRTGHAWGSPKMLLSDIGSGILRVQMDTITQRKTGQAPLVGPGSNVAEAKIVNP